MMTTNIDLAGFEPTDEMKKRWPGINDKTAVEITNARRIDVPTLVYRSETEVRTGAREPGPMPTFSTERLDLIQVGDHLCYYRQDSDTLFVRNPQRKMDNPETIKDTLYLPDAGAFDSGETIEDGQFSGATVGEIVSLLVTKSESHDFHIGQTYEKNNASKLFCVNCGWELCLRSG